MYWVGAFMRINVEVCVKMKNEKNETDTSFLSSSQRCVSCDEEHPLVSTRVQKFSYGSGDERVELEARVPVWTCRSCDEQWTDQTGEEARHEAVCRHLGRLTPREIKAVREAYGLSQEEWAAKTGFGSASIKRWETGALIQNAAADQLIRLLAYRDNYARISKPTSIKKERSSKIFRTHITEELRRRAGAFELHSACVLA